MILSALLLAGALAFQDAPVNAMCPVMTDEPVEADITLEWEGRTIGFCCKSCLRDFRKEPEAFVANLPPVEVAEPVVAAVAEPPGLAERVGRFHVTAVHFPVALLIAAAIAELFGAAAASRFCVRFGAVAALVAAGLGWLHEDHVRTPLEEIMERHEDLGWWTAGVASVAALLSFGKGGMLYRLVLVAAAVLVALTGHWGGVLVYGEDFLFG